MKRPLVAILGFVGLCGGYAAGQHIPGHAGGPSAGPTTAPMTMPAGHPAIPGMGGMPAGHPALPGGHPDMAGASTLPTGHPKIDVKLVEFANLVLRVKPGTKDAPVPAKEKAVIELYGLDGKVVSKHDVTLDDAGTAKIEKISMAKPLQPVVTMNYGGIEQQGVGPVLDGTAETQDLTMTVYQAATEPPAWTVPGRRVVVTVEGGNLSVRDMVGVFNPLDKAWAGAASGADKGVTIAIPLSAGVEKLDGGLGGDPNLAKIVGGVLRITAPMFPGGVQYPLNYKVPVKDGAATVTIGMSGLTEELAVYVPAGLTIKVDGVTEGKVLDMGPHKMRFFTAKNIKTNQVVTLTFSGMAPPAATKAAGH